MIVRADSKAGSKIRALVEICTSVTEINIDEQIIIASRIVLCFCTVPNLKSSSFIDRRPTFTGPDAFGICGRWIRADIIPILNAPHLLVSSYINGINRTSSSPNEGSENGAAAMSNRFEGVGILCGNNKPSVKWRPRVDIGLSTCRGRSESFYIKHTRRKFP